MNQIDESANCVPSHNLSRVIAFERQRKLEETRGRNTRPTELSLLSLLNDQCLIKTKMASIGRSLCTPQGMLAHDKSQQKVWLAD